MPSPKKHRKHHKKRSVTKAESRKNWVTSAERARRDMQRSAAYINEGRYGRPAGGRGEVPRKV